MLQVCSPGMNTALSLVVRPDVPPSAGKVEQTNRKGTAMPTVRRLRAVRLEPQVAEEPKASPGLKRRTSGRRHVVNAGTSGVGRAHPNRVRDVRNAARSPTPRLYTSSSSAGSTVQRPPEVTSCSTEQPGNGNNRAGFRMSSRQAGLAMPRLRYRRGVRNTHAQPQGGSEHSVVGIR